MSDQVLIDERAAHRLAPHPWDAVASRVFPGAQTLDEAERALREREVSSLVGEVEDHRREAEYLFDRIGDENLDGDKARDRLVNLVGEEEARKALGDRWDGTWV